MVSAVSNNTLQNNSLLGFFSLPLILERLLLRGLGALVTYLTKIINPRHQPYFFITILG